jgi:two-component system, NarL family, nitrate/nitrite response regulator NarL
MSDKAAPEVLVVEDDPNFAARLCTAVALWHPDARIVLLATGREAIDRIAASPRTADLALIDLGLPDMDGGDVIAAARQSSANTAILVVSLLTSENSVISAIRSGANGYIIKDGSDQSIASAITEVINGNYPLSPALARHLFRLVKGSASESDVALTERETDVLRCIGRGLSYEQTAVSLGVSISTVQSHVRNLYRKLEVNSQIQAALKARDRGII